MSRHNVLEELGVAANSNIIKDPGNAGNILLQGRSLGVCELVSAGAETRTLPRPTAVGQRALISMITDAGDITLTVTGGINEDGDTTFTFSDPGQFLDLVSIRTVSSGTSTYAWRKISDYGLGNIAPGDASVLDEFSGLAATADELNATSDVSTRTVTFTGTQLTVTAALYGDRDVLLDNTHTVTVTLPAASGSGNRYNFLVKTLGTDGSKVIAVANTTDVIRGASIAANTQSTTIGFIATASDDTITLNNTTTGGAVGTRVTLLDAAAGVFLVNVFNITTGNPATPFSNSV